MFVRKVLGGCIVLVLIGALAACGSSSSSGGGGGASASTGVAPSAWVKSVCSAVVPFKNDVQRRAGALSFAGVKSVAEVKQKLEGFMAAASADATQTASKIQSAGTPNTPNGKHDAAVLVSAFNKLAGAMSSAEAQAKALPTSSPAAFEAQAPKVSATIQKALTSITPSFNSLKENPALDRAAKSTPACAGVAQ